MGRGGVQLGVCRPPKKTSRLPQRLTAAFTDKGLKADLDWSFSLVMNLHMENAVANEVLERLICCQHDC